MDDIQAGSHTGPTEASGGKLRAIDGITGTYGFGDFLKVGGLDLFQRTFEIQAVHETYFLKVNGAEWGTLVGSVNSAGPWLFIDQTNRYVSIGRCNLPHPGKRKLVTLTLLQFDDTSSDPTATGIWIGTSTSGNVPPPGSDTAAKR